MAGIGRLGPVVDVGMQMKRVLGWIASARNDGASSLGVPTLASGLWTIASWTLLPHQVEGPKGGMLEGEGYPGCLRWTLDSSSGSYVTYTNTARYSAVRLGLQLRQGLRLALNMALPSGPGLVMGVLTSSPVERTKGRLNSV